MWFLVKISEFPSVRKFKDFHEVSLWKCRIKFKGLHSWIQESKKVHFTRISLDTTYHKSIFWWSIFRCFYWRKLNQLWLLSNAFSKLTSYNSIEWSTLTWIYSLIYWLNNERVIRFETMHFKKQKFESCFLDFAINLNRYLKAIRIIYSFLHAWFAIRNLQSLWLYPINGSKYFTNFFKKVYYDHLKYEW